jgi:hypothetical protein
MPHRRWRAGCAIIDVRNANELAENAAVLGALHW